VTCLAIGLARNRGVSGARPASRQTTQANVGPV